MRHALLRVLCLFGTKGRRELLTSVPKSYKEAYNWTDVTYNAVVVYARGAQLGWKIQTQRGTSDATDTSLVSNETVKAMNAYLEARPNDASSMHVMKGNFLTVLGRWDETVTSLDKAVQLDEEECLGANTLADIYINKIPGVTSPMKNQQRQEAHSEPFVPLRRIFGAISHLLPTVTGGMFTVPAFLYVSTQM
jgi:hypothetical protein